MRIIDGLVAFWVVFWLVVAGATAYSTWRLAGLGTTLSSSGRALDDAGAALQVIGQVPIVGDRPEALGNDVRATAADVVAQGKTTRDSLHRLAVLLGVFIALVPSVPVLAFYLPARWNRRREKQAVRRRLRDGDGGGLDHVLAARALAQLPVDTLLRIRPDSSRKALADAELARLGVRRPDGGR
ncbi:MAG TPA: hypothetical protein VI357_01405 [Mycobacteriales bacterium]